MFVRSRGFTLIELLLVVSIIGMLSSIILASMASARDKANDAAVKSNLRTAAVQAALHQSINGSYGSTVTAGTCPTSGTSMFYANETLRNAIQAAQRAGGGATRCATNGENYAISVRLRSSTDHWCIDSSGIVKQTSTTGWTGVACP
ncbi:MAG TPA: type II secretion system protein [Candidatus Paceibacterota bacterium]|nr:type II secretion system protein [Candidatus Paceibacterota bacterium]